MGWFKDNRHWVLLTCFLVSVVLTVGVGLLGAVAVLGAMAPTGEGFLLVRMLRAGVPYLIGLLVLGIFDVVFFLGTIVAVLRRASMPRSDRLADLAESLEGKYPALRSVGVSEKVEPTVEQRREKLKEQYVEGEIGEDEFERRMRELIDEDDDDPLSNAPDVDLDVDLDSDSDRDRDGDRDRGTNIDLE